MEEQVDTTKKPSGEDQARSIVKSELHRDGYVISDAYIFAALLQVRTVGVMGDNRTYFNPILIEVVDEITNGHIRLSWNTLSRISTRITNEVEGVNRVVYDVSKF